MKPNFALDLSHEGINLLHRSKGGWHLVGSVALDDPDVGGRLEALHRSAAMLESGGITTKVIIPDSQILYTTVDAPGPDDIAREVQIRTALDGLTPYPVGELVFDWRAQGDKARVAVLARETMDEAEGFAAQHMFNPVSFVARPGRGVFSGEPFFGKSRASAKILPPGERIEPDATPVPRNPGAATLPETARVSPEASPPDAPDAEPPFVEDFSGAVPEPVDVPLPDATLPQAQAPTAPAAQDDPFAELDQIAAELAAEEVAPTQKKPSRKPRGKRGKGSQPVAPPQLAPFPPTPDEADKAAMSAPRTLSPSTAPPLPASPPDSQTEIARQHDEARGQPEPATTAQPSESTPPPAEPMSFSSSRTAEPGLEGSRDAPANRLSGIAPRIGVPTPAATAQAPAPHEPAATAAPPIAPAPTTLPPPPGALHADRLRSDMAEALAKPLPRVGEKPSPAPEPSPGLLSSLGASLRKATAARSSARAEKKSKAAEAALANTQPAPKPAQPDAPPPRKGMFAKRSTPSEAERQRDAEAEALTVFGARKGQTQPDRPKYLGLILTLILLILMGVVALWSGYVVDDGKTALFNPGPEVTTSPATTPAAPASSLAESTTPTPPPPAATAEVLSPEAAEAHYAATGIWERAPEVPSEPETTRLDDPQITNLGDGVTGRAPTPLPDADPGATRDIALADPVPPPPPGTVFNLDENGLVVPTPDGALSPTGVLVFRGKPATVPPAPPAGLFPQTPAPAPAPEPAPDQATEQTPAQAPAATGVQVAADAAVDAALSGEAATAPPVALPGVPATRPASRPQVIPTLPEPVTEPAATPEVPAAATPDDNAAIDAAVEDVVLAAFENASELAVAASRQPAPRPDGFAKLVSAAQARASDGSQVIAAAATTTPAIPTSASVATRATSKNALNLRRINLIGIYGSSSARRALVRLDNGRYVKVEVGDRLDGGKVTSISASQLTYQKGRKAYKLEVLPLG